MRRRFTSVGKIPFDINNYLTIEALEDGLEVSFFDNIEYGIDGVGWTRLKQGEYTQAINAGQCVSFKGRCNPSSSSGIGKFLISKKCRLVGNAMSMLFADDAATAKDLTGYDYAFYQLFTGCVDSIQSVSSGFLPATTLSYGCYSYMFSGCKYIENTPELPATNLAQYCYDHMFELCTSLTHPTTILPATNLVTGCYQYMFSSCSSLTAAPELPATNLAQYCYNRMFLSCTNLNYIKMLATDISAAACLNYWVIGVASSGTFVKNKNATWNVTGDSGVPSGWTIQTV